MTAAERLPASKLCRASAIDFDTAQALIEEAARPIGIETVPLNKAGRRVLAQPVLAALDSPRADTAAMDGYAVATHDIKAGLRRFRLAGACYPGAAMEPALDSGTAIRIMTGSAMPKGADRVIMQEQTWVDGDCVVLTGSFPDKAHVREQGSDFLRGDVLLSEGQTLNPRAMVAVAAADASEVTVWRRPCVSLIASGDELTAPGMAADNANTIPDSLSDAVLLLARQWGAKPGTGVRVQDRPQAIEQAARRLLEDCDVLVMIGGASRGDRDFARLGLIPLGLETEFAEIPMKPGKPVWYGRIGERHVLGLPGNPTAAMTIARLFLVPLIVRLGGQAACQLAPRKMTLAQPTALVPREQFLCGYKDGEAARMIERQSSSAQAMLTQAELLIRIPTGAGTLPAGTYVDVYHF